jgi:predicted metal-dependent hydrolase
MAATEMPTLNFVRHPRARRYIIRVAGDGHVRVTIPRWGSRRDAEAFAQREHAWIDRQLRQLQEARERRAVVPDRAPTREPEAERALREQARRELPTRLLALAAQLGFAAGRVRKISIRNQKWRWGSCSPDGHICLNWRLVQMPDAVRDYVLVHELMHLKRPDHSPKFWALVAEACPDYRAARDYLRATSDSFA